MGKLGKYVCLEGIDGTGKTTQLNKFRNDWFITKEPGSPYSKVCKDIRQILIHNTPKEQFTMGYLFLGDSFEHLSTVVKPKLNEGIDVLSDRCLISDFAYRPNFPYEIRKPVINLFQELKPTIIFLELDPDIAQQRMLNSDRKGLNKYEIEQVIDRLEQLQQNYINILNSLTIPVYMVDSSCNESKLFDKIIKLI